MFKYVREINKQTNKHTLDSSLGGCLDYTTVA